MPKYALGIIGNEMVFAFNADEFHGLSKNAQSIEDLNTFTDRHVGVGSSVEKKQRSVNLIGIKE